jgi:hypothetical protein
MTKVPEHVFIILESSRWSVTAIADGHPYVTDQIVTEINRRVSRGDEWGRANLHIYKCRITDVVEVEITMPEVAKAQITVKAPDPGAANP